MTNAYQVQDGELIPIGPEKPTFVSDPEAKRLFLRDLIKPPVKIWLLVLEDDNPYPRLIGVYGNGREAYEVGIKIQKTFEQDGGELRVITKEI